MDATAKVAPDWFWAASGNDARTRAIADIHDRFMVISSPGAVQTLLL